jgi:predicted transcriptional regulator
MSKKGGDSQQRVDEIVVELLANELSVAKIAKEFGVTKAYVYQVNSGECGRMDGFKYPVREKKYPPKEAPTDNYGELI